ncbi:AraC family transcriptional regulator [Actinacidiphila glaucinigra]|uniref:AraC family transcriptional regulator n=1 Tax=Actinacidiphila glaucinigra TaxID=235986 RepID=UPI0036AA5DE2
MISQSVAGLRVGRGTVRRFRESGAWGMRYAGLTGSGFHVVLRGGAWLVTADAPPVALGPGDVVLITSGADHGLSHAPRPLPALPSVTLGADRPAPGPAAPGDFEFLCGAYRLERGRVHPYLASLPDPLVVSPDRARFPAFGPVVDLLDADASLTGAGAGAARAAVLDLMLVHVLRQVLEDRGAGARPLTSDPAVSAVLGAMHDAPDRPWTVTRLGDLVGLSRAALTRRFTSVVGTPPMTYLRDVRLGAAARLLRETDASLAAIARQVGYGTEFAFAGAFRRAFGVSPGRFRLPDDAPGNAAHGTPRADAT